MRGELYILSSGRILSTQLYDALVLTSLSSSASSTHLPSSSSPWERVSWLCFRLSAYDYFFFISRFIGFLELFSNSPLIIFCHCWHGPASCLAIKRTIWSELARAWWPPWAAFGHSSHGPASMPDCPENHVIWMDSIQAVLFALHAIFPLTFFSSFKDCLSLLYHVDLLYIIYIFHHILFSDDSYCNCLNILVYIFQQPIIANYYQYCLITVWLLFVILILEMYYRYFNLVKK